MNPIPDMDELRLVTALTEVLRARRAALVEGGPAALSPLWQPLLDELACFTQARTAEARAPSPDLVAGVQALQREYDGLRHGLEVWGAALDHARRQVESRTESAVYGAVPASSGRTLGRS